MTDGRTATASDLEPVADTLAGAFFDDPVWAWAFPDPEQRRKQHAALWGLLLEGSIGYGWVWTTAGHEAATLWIPPGLPELPDAQAERLEPLLDELHQPAYLESTNPANLDRYRSVGFEPIGDFDLPHGGPVVTRMWRDAR